MIDKQKHARMSYTLISGKIREKESMASCEWDLDVGMAN